MSENLIIKKYKEWLNEGEPEKNSVQARRAGLEPWEVFLCEVRLNGLNMPKEQKIEQPKGEVKNGKRNSKKTK